MFRWKEAVIGPVATGLSAIIIVVGANCAASKFEPMFVGEGRFLWNLRSIVELQVDVDGKECQLILSNAESVVVPGDDSTTQEQLSNAESVVVPGDDSTTWEQFFTSHKLNKKDCHALRGTLKPWTR